jgi:HTH-type transcriptional regulator, competence development regulator
MKLEVTREWCLAMANLEGDAEIGAGAVAIDPTFNGHALQKTTDDEANVAFSRFIRLMRRDRGLTVEQLAQETDVELAELVEIEEDTRHRPELRTVYQLAQFFNLPGSKLMQIAGLTASNDNRLSEEAVRFAARSESVTALTAEERAALEAFVVVLSEEDSHEGK